MNDKQRVAIAAADLVRNNMIVGLGTGSTANCFIEELAHRQAQGLSIQVVSSSITSAITAKKYGLHLLSIEQIGTLDFYVDGADEVSPQMDLLKGKGSDLVREKLLARAADSFIVLIDASKQVDYIGQKYAIPIEVLPFAWQLVKNSLQQLGGQGDLRPNATKDGLAMSSHGSLILDMAFEHSIDLQQLDIGICSTPGVVEHGIFRNLATAIFVGNDGAVTQHWQKER